MTQLFWSQPRDGGMIRTSATGTHNVTPSLPNGPDGGDSDVTMRNCGCQVWHRHTERTLHRHASDAAWMDVCPAQNIGGQIASPSHDNRGIGNGFCDNIFLLKASPMEILSLLP